MSTVTSSITQNLLSQKWVCLHCPIIWENLSMKDSRSSTCRVFYLWMKLQVHMWEYMWNFSCTTKQLLKSCLRYNLKYYQNLLSCCSLLIPTLCLQKAVALVPGSIVVFIVLHGWNGVSNLNLRQEKAEFQNNKYLIARKYKFKTY
jgi:hypothetical protein